MGLFQQTAEKLLWKIVDGGQRSKKTETRSSLENPQTPLSFPAEWLL